MSSLLVRSRRVALAVLALSALPLTVHALANVDQAAPAFTVQGADGKPVSLSAYKGKTVVLEWTNHECPFVRKHYESKNIPNLQKEATGAGVVWLQVISSTPGSQGAVDGAGATKLNQQRGAAPTAVLLDTDGKVGKAYGAQTTPHMYVINADGNLVYKGGIDSIASTKTDDIAKAQPYVKLALADVAAGRKVAQASTRPYGCSIKYSD